MLPGNDDVPPGGDNVPPVPAEGAAAWAAVAPAVVEAVPPPEQIGLGLLLSL